MKKKDDLIKYRDEDEKPLQLRKVEYKSIKTFDHDVLRGRNFTPIYIGIAVVIIICLFLFIPFATVPTPKPTHQAHFVQENMTTTRTSTHHDHEVMNYKINYQYSCTDPYESVCKNYNGISLFDKGDKQNKELIRYMENDIKNSEQHKKYVFKKDVKIVDIQQRTKDMNLFFRKCVDFFDIDHSKRLKLISENHLLLDLIKEIHKFETFSSLVGKLSKHNVETPITIDLRPFVIDKNTFKTEEIYSIELSGDPLLFIDVDIDIQEERRVSLKNFYKKNAVRILELIGYHDYKLIIQNHEKIRDFLVNAGLRRNYIKNIDNEFNIVTFTQVHFLFKNFNFDEYLHHSGFQQIKYATKMNMNKPEFFREFDENFNKYKIIEWKHYFIINVLYSMIKRVFNIGTHLENKREKCLRFTKEYYPIGACRNFKHHLQHTEHYGNEADVIKKLNNVIHGMIQEYAEKVRMGQFCLHGSESKEEVIQKLNNLKVVIGTCSVIDKINKIAYTGDAWLNEMEKSEYSITSEFIEKSSFIEIINEFHQLEVFKLQRHEDYDIYYKNSVNTLTDLNAWFDNYFNAVVIPPGLLVYPFHSKYFRNHQIWSVLTVVVGHELFHAFKFYLDSGVKITQTERMCLKNMQNEFIKLYDCHKKDLNDKNYGKRTLDENMADFYGLQTSYENWFRNEDKMNIGEKEKKFFLNYLQIWCKDDFYDYKPDVHASLSNRANIPLLSVREHVIRSLNCSFDEYNKKC